MATYTEQLIRLSRRVGADPTQVLAGGGNSSVKTGDTMFVKASGTMMATMSREGLVEVDLEQVLAIPDYAHFSADRDEKENQIAMMLMDARVAPQRDLLRPSVETVLHALLPQRYVLHTHAERVNALTFGRQGADLFEQLAFKSGVRALWVRYIDPGLTLAQAMQHEIDSYREQHGYAPNVIFMAKHGHLVAADSVKATLDLQEHCQEVVDKLHAKRARALKRAGNLPPDFGGPRVDQLQDEALDAAIARIAPMIRSQLSDPTCFVHYWASDILETFAGARHGKRLAQGGPLCPDQVVYCLPAPLWLEPNWNADDADLRAAAGQALDNFREKYSGRDPKLVLIPGIGCLAVGPSLKDAHLAAEMYESMVDCKAKTAAFGGVLPLNKRETQFIDTWSAEQYRRKLSSGEAVDARARNKVVAITGAGQGVGREMALLLADAGAHLLLIDINEDALDETAQLINDKHALDPSFSQYADITVCNRAFSCTADVTDESQLRFAMQQAAVQWGGLDVAIANAGILKAFKVTQFPTDTWRRIIDVNLVGVFATMKAAAEIMVRQRSGDIIQINSKSGKVGSKYNSAYAASKFGGIGLVQSLALDLIEDNVCVNAICPGNFFDLPLWSAPGGLFDQYRAKFDNAPREEVRKIYESKIPMGRGCHVTDVVKTILYIIEQGYETGQAYNVSGGQEMR